MGKKTRWSKWIGLTTIALLMTLLFGMSAMAAGTPTGLKQTGDSTSAVQIEWTAVSGTNIRYDVEVSQNNVTWGAASTSAVTGTSFAMSGLATGKDYYFRVRAYEYGSTVYSNWSSVLTATTSPGTISKIEQTNATQTSITLKWSAAAGANRYEIYYYQNNQLIKTPKVTTSTSITIGNLKNSNQYAVVVFPMRTCGSYFGANLNYASTYVKLIPGKVSKVKLASSNFKTKQIQVQWTANTKTDGYELILYNNSGKKVKSVTLNSGGYYYNTFKKIKSTSFYKFKIRAFVKLNSGKKYGAWNEIYVANQPKLIGERSNGGVKLSWAKVAGATSYTVYVSTNQNTGYKKAATVKGTSYTSYKVKGKTLQSGKTYYYYVVANKKVKGKTYKSGSQYCWSYII